MEDLADYLTSEFYSANEISDEWVASTVDGNFTEFEAISTVVRPQFFDQDDDVQLQHYTNLCRNLLKFESTHDKPEVWKLLVERSIPGRKLTILLWYSIERALMKNSTLKLVQCGVEASCAYLYLCSIKGSQAYHIFNQYLYQRCLDLFRLLYRCLTYDCREANTKGKAKGKGKGGKKKNVTIEQEDDAAEVVHLDSGEVRELLETSTKGLFVLLSKFPLSAFNEAAVATVNFVRDLSRLEATRDTRTAPADDLRHFDRMDCLGDRCFALMHKLSEDRHGHGAMLVLSRFVYPRLAFWGFDMSTVPSSATIPAVFTQWKDLIVRFLEERVAVGAPAEMMNLLKLLENLYCRCTDRQDYRSKVSQTLVQVLLILPYKYQYEFIQRVDAFSKSSKTAARNFTVEVVPTILKSLDLTQPDPGPITSDHVRQTTINETVAEKTTRAENEDVDMDEDRMSDDERPKKKEAAEKKTKKKKGRVALPRVEPLSALYQSVVRCCVDKSSSVRGRAIIQLATLLADDTHRQGIIDNAQILRDQNVRMFFVGSEEKTGEDGEDEDAGEVQLDDSEIHIDNLVLFIITKAMEDEKANVRKSALLAIQSFFPAITSMDEFTSTIAVVRKRCVDSSLMVRKQAADTMTHILAENKYFRPEMEDAWLKSVLPMINDREQSVQQAASKMITDTIIFPILGDTTEGAWSLMQRIEQEDNHRRLLVRALFHQAREGHLNARVVEVLNRKLVSDPERCDVIWMMLSELGVVFKVNPSLALETWYQLEEGDDNNKVRYVAKVLTSSANQLKEDQLRALCEDIKGKIANYDVAAPHISTVYLCLAKLLDGVGEAAKGWAVLKEFGSKVLSGCRKQVRKNLEDFTAELHLKDGETLASMETRLIRVITTIGEVIQFSPTLINSCGEMVKALKTIMAADEIQSNPELRDMVLNSAVPSINPTPLPSRAASRGPEPGGERVGSSQGSGSGGSQPLSSQGGPIIPAHVMRNQQVLGCSLFTSTVRSYCVLAIGKFCLMDEKLAKECVPVLVRQLKVNRDHIVRNNIVFVICDLCIRYTLLVDRYSPIIAGCLRDRSTLVRHHTLESLTNLIKEQFIRWEGQIMYRFVSTILDESPRIREYAEFCLKEVLLLQFPTMFYHHFIECLLYFNDVTKKYMPGSSDADVDQSLKFTLSGRENAAVRMKLYKFMLATFDDKEKFATMAHICEQVLCPVFSGEFNFEEANVQNLLRDAFEIMSSEEIKLDMNVGKAGDDDEDEVSPAMVATAKKMISEAFRKGIIQAIMPPLLEMRQFLREKRSPMQQGCFAVLRAICRQHQEQLDEFLAGDRQLKAEIEFDIKRLEHMEKMQRAAAKKAEEEARLARRRSRRSIAAAAVLLAQGAGAQDGGEAMDVADAEPQHPVNEQQPQAMEVDEPVATPSQRTPGNTSSQSSSSAGTRVKTRLSTLPEEAEVEVKQEEPCEDAVQEAGPNSVGTSRGRASRSKTMQASQTVSDGEPMDVDAPPVRTTASDPPTDQTANDSMHTAVETEILQTLSNNPNISMRRRRSSRNLSSTEAPPTFAAPPLREATPPSVAAPESEVKKEVEDGEMTPPEGPVGQFAVPKRTGNRKRSRVNRAERENTVDRVMNESVVAGRAISTPNKAMDSDLTFAGLDLSAIVADDSNAKQSQIRKSRVQRKTRSGAAGQSSTMDTISEQD